MNKVLELFIGLGLTLTLASLIAAVLKRYVAHGQPHAVIDNLTSRINAWWVMVVVLGLAFLAGRDGVIFLFALLSFFALREYMSLAYTRKDDHSALAIAFYIGLPMQYFLVWLEWYGLYSIFIPVYGFLVLPILAVLGGDTQRFLERTTKVQWGLMLCVYCLSYVPALLTLPIAGFEKHNLWLIAYLLVVVQASDVLQYIWGKLLGRRLIAPQVSPSKTLAGFVGGLGSATLLGTALYSFTPFTPWQAVVVSALISLMGFLGGLVMSAIKRDRGVKDWGRLVEGHGGILDRLDSILFAAPVFFHVLRYGWV